MTTHETEPVDDNRVRAIMKTVHDVLGLASEPDRDLCPDDTLSALAFALCIYARAAGASDHAVCGLLFRSLNAADTLLTTPEQEFRDG